MLHKLVWSFALGIALSLSASAAVNPAQSATQKGNKESASKQARWEGLVIRHDSDGHTLTVCK